MNTGTESSETYQLIQDWVTENKQAKTNDNKSPHATVFLNSETVMDNQRIIQNIFICNFSLILFQLQSLILF